MNITNNMTLVHSGKTKAMYKGGSEDKPDYYLVFKDDATGTNGIFDPGANQVGLTITDKAHADIRLTEYFFRAVEQTGIINTHRISTDPDNVTMKIKPAKLFGKGLEFICRLRATGSFVRRYGIYIKDGAPLDYLVESTIKDDKHDDPPITEATLLALGLLARGQYDILTDLTKDIARIVEFELFRKGMELYDIKFEFGLDANGLIMLIDEISTGSMRVYKDGKKLEPLEITELFFA